MEGSVDLTSLQSGKGHALASQVRMPILTSCPQRIRAQFQRLAERQTGKNDLAFEAGLGPNFRTKFELESIQFKYGFLQVNFQKDLFKLSFWRVEFWKEGLT